VQRDTAETAVTDASETPFRAPFDAVLEDAVDRGRRTFLAAFVASFAITFRLDSAIPVIRRPLPSPAVRIPSAASNSGGSINANSDACGDSPRFRVPFTM
jgi:hypothetical protein